MNLDWRVVEDNMERHRLTPVQRELARVFVVTGAPPHCIAPALYMQRGSVKARMFETRRRMGARDNIDLYRRLTT